MKSNEPLWAFMEYVSFGGRGEITKWVNKKIEVDAKDDFHDLLKKLGSLSRDLWTRPDYGIIDANIGEIRFECGNLQHRVFGFFLVEEKQYVMAIGSTKKGKIYKPADAIQAAKDRRKEILKDKQLIKEYKYGRE